MKKRSKYLVILAVLICLVGCSGQGYHKDLEKNPQWIDVQNGKIYYARDDGIYQINEKGDTKCLTEEYTTIFTIVQNDLFYFKNRVELWKKDNRHQGEKIKMTAWKKKVWAAVVVFFFLSATLFACYFLRGTYSYHTKKDI